MKSKKKPDKNGPINQIIAHLQNNPYLLGCRASSPTLRILYSDQRKRYTEFYRIEFTGKGLEHKKDHRFWVRKIKNKPPDIINEALYRQFSILEKVYAFFENQNYKKLHLSCSKPVAILPEFGALVTKECSGRLWNKDLCMTVPYFSKLRIKEDFFNSGKWLKIFHGWFREEMASDLDMEDYFNEFQAKFKRPPRKTLQYITLCHNDFSPRNIFVSKNSIEVIDFVGSKKGFPEEDIEFFCNYLLKAKLNLLYPFSLKKEMIASFHKGYFAEGI